ncbi:TetR/AcrR family transcriptional regulator [Aestuariicella hydrocarbonica]|uniref:TetR/AcrR family transcriptional regulator n=1 Tax=Pseudomaricurvus hydrocarbonicus TaxID=1470433 RepID=A0A9E5JWI3_9GAMM|nr:TetR/AcrR family transcriptional regulator [Aestuariicella hydrocarbonica]NHO65861.1 TetR/AcrR family transcriptional regulator [Aestuariicella hydrocarbonica]
MSTKGNMTRNKLMDIAERRILQKGFSATSIEDIITEAGISKGGFFYHFEGKDDLAYALMQRYREQDAFLFSGLFRRAEELLDDPLQQMLLFIKLLAEMMDQLEDLHPGCLVASFTYESHEVNDQVKAITADSVMDWRQLFSDQLNKVHQHYPPKLDVNTTDLADLLSTVIEGGIVVSRAIGDKKLLVRQLLEYRNYIRLLYEA